MELQPVTAQNWNALIKLKVGDDQPVGFVRYCFSFGHSRFQAFIMRLMVDQRFQGKGYGREIMQWVRC